MLDEQLWDDDDLRLGLRYEGPRTPSQILDALMPDLVWAEQKQMEAGHDWMSVASVPLQARAFMALLESEPDLDIPFDGDDDESLDTGPEHMVLCQHIANLMEFLQDLTPALTIYDWASENAESDGYYALGVWPNWAEINKGVEEGRILVIEDRETLAAHHQEIRKSGYEHAILEDGEDTVLFSTLNCEEQWRW